MRRCEACSVDIEGYWKTCPLCGESVRGTPVPSPFPDPPLRFSRRRLLKTLFVMSVLAVLASVAIQMVFREWFEGLGHRRFAWLGVITMWLVVLTAVRQRHNVVRGTLYWVVLVWLLAAYWDYFTGWEAWSVTYAIPIVATSALVALLIVTWGTRVEPGEHVVYSALAAVLGLVPAVFLVTGLVSDPWASALCVALSVVTLVVIAAVRGRHVRHEFRKRFDL